jgi:hypothetical protein
MTMAMAMPITKAARVEYPAWPMTWSYTCMVNTAANKANILITKDSAKAWR